MKPFIFKLLYCHFYYDVVRMKSFIFKQNVTYSFCFVFWSGYHIVFNFYGSLARDMFYKLTPNLSNATFLEIRYANILYKGECSPNFYWFIFIGCKITLFFDLFLIQYRWSYPCKQFVLLFSEDSFSKHSWYRLQFVVSFHLFQPLIFLVFNV